MTSTAAATSQPTLEQLEDSMEKSGLILTKKNITDEENFIVELQEVFNVSYLTLHPLFALPVSWAAAKLHPAPNRPLNQDLFDDANEVLDIAAVVAFPKSVARLRLPAKLEVHRCSRITLPPKKAGGSTEDALLIFSYKSQENYNSSTDDTVGQ